MSNEATLNLSMAIRKVVDGITVIDYRSSPANFQATVTGTKGPTPGAFRASLAGTKVDLSELTTPGLCRIFNMDSANYIIYGVFDGVEFYPLGECLPGESWPIRLSRYLGRSIGTGIAGTGTYDVGVYSLMVKATVAPCNVVVEAFEA